MPLWDKVKQELDRAGRVAQDALDEGRIRLEAFRARQHADRSAQALGYALFRARSAGSDLDPQTYERLSATLARHEAEASRLESQLEDIQGRRRTGWTADAGTADTPPAGTDRAAGTAGAEGTPGTTAGDTQPSPDTISPIDTGRP